MANYTLPTNLADSCDGVLYCLALWAEEVTQGLFWAAILLAFVVILILATQRFGSARSIGFGAVFGALASTYLATMQLMAWWIATIFILGGGAGLVIMFLNEK